MRAVKKTREELNAAFWALASDDALVDRDMAGAVAHLGRKSMELLAMNGEGPVYSVPSGKALYRKGDVIAWLRKREHRIAATAQRAHRPPERLKGEAAISPEMLEGATGKSLTPIGPAPTWRISKQTFQLAEQVFNRWVAEVPNNTVAEDLHLKPEPFALLANLLTFGDDIRLFTKDGKKIIDLVCVGVKNKGSAKAEALCHVTLVLPCTQKERSPHGQES